MKRAVTIHKRLCQLDFERRTALQTLDNINMGLALVDQFQQVLFANNQARALLANQDGLALNEQSLECSDPGTQQRLSEAVGMVIAKAAEGEIEAGRAIAIKRPSGGRDYSLLVSPVWGNLIQLETRGPGLSYSRGVFAGPGAGLTYPGQIAAGVIQFDRG